VATEPPVLTVRDAYEIAAAYPAPGRDRFYGALAGAALGAGVILQDVEYPLFVIEDGSWGRFTSLAMVLTHECDLDQENERVLNDVALVCPIIDLESFTLRINAVLDCATASRFIANVSARYINRLLYLPAIPDHLPLGGYLYLNLLTNTHLSKLTSAAPICMLSPDGFRELDFAVERHFLRPKADRMPFEVTQ
jgi:hypothetical protein